jgi:hypothetical protein
MQSLQLTADQQNMLETINRAYNGLYFGLPTYGEMNYEYQKGGADGLRKTIEADRQRMRDIFDELKPWEKAEVIAQKESCEKFYEDFLRVDDEQPSKTKHTDVPLLLPTSQVRECLADYSSKAWTVWLCLATNVIRAYSGNPINDYVYAAYCTNGKLAATQPIRLIAEKTGMSTTTVTKAIKELIAKGAIFKHKLPNKFNSRENVKSQSVYVLGYQNNNSTLWKILQKGEHPDVRDED